jgi:hypothetical protein
MRRSYSYMYSYSYKSFFVFEIQMIENLVKIARRKRVPPNASTRVDIRSGSEM